mgnify:CR=1 FL=1
MKTQPDRKSVEEGKREKLRRDQEPEKKKIKMIEEEVTITTIYSTLS